MEEPGQEETSCAVWTTQEVSVSSIPSVSTPSDCFLATLLPTPSCMGNFSPLSHGTRHPLESAILITRVGSTAGNALAAVAVAVERLYDLCD